MAQLVISGPGVGLPPPQALYPSYINNSNPLVPSANEVSLAPGDALPIPAGTWLIQTGPYSVLQWLDPVTGTWRGFASALSKVNIIQSDGFTRRIANLTGCPIAAVVTNAGSSYVQSTTSVSVSAGNSTWQPIVGGALTLTSITSAGANYSMPPICVLSAPPSPGVQATAVAAISSGTVSTITVTNQGAGYTTAPTITLLPNPADPNIATITNGTATFGLTGSGKITAVLCTNPGTSLAAQPTLTIAGAGSSAAATAVWMNTIASSTITANGAGYAADNLVTTSGGVTSATAVWTNPSVELTGYIPRPAQGVAAVASTLNTITSISTFYDRGLFTGTPKAVVAGGAVTTVASITLGLGGLPDICVMQPV